MDDTRTWMQERIDGRLAAGVGVAWFVAYQIAGSLEPRTDQPEPAFGIALGVTLLLLLAVTATGLVMQRRWGLVASLAAAGFFTALSIACPISGHHAFGAWWFGQMACTVGIGALTVVALRWSTDMPDWFPTARPAAAVRSGEQDGFDAVTEREELSPARRAPVARAGTSPRRRSRRRTPARAGTSRSRCRRWRARRRR